MSKINDYKRKKVGYDRIDEVRPYGNPSGKDMGCNMPTYSFQLETNGSSPEPEWLYEAIVRCWKVIQEEMKKIAAADVNTSLAKAIDEANNFLGRVRVEE